MINSVYMHAYVCVCVYIYGAFLMATQSEKNTIRGFRCDSMVKKVHLPMQNMGSASDLQGSHMLQRN